MGMKRVTEMVTVDSSIGMAEEISAIKKILREYIPGLLGLICEQEEESEWMSSAAYWLDEANDFRPGAFARPGRISLELDGDVYCAEGNVCHGDDLERFLRKMETARHIVWNAEYSIQCNMFMLDFCKMTGIGNETGLNAFIYKHLQDEYGNAPEAADIRTYIQYDNEGYTLIYSPAGSSVYTNGKANFTEGLDGVREVKKWCAEFLGFEVDIDRGIGEEKLDIIRDSFKALDSKYDTEDIWEDLIEEYDDRIRGGGWGSYSFTAGQLQEFFAEAEKLRKLIKELDPTGSLKIYGYINTADYDHRFGVIETKTNADGEFVISSTKFC